MSKRFDVCICGGGMLYNSMLPYYHKVYVNKVDADGEAEVFFPNLDKYEGMRLHQVLPEVYDAGYKTRLHVYVKNIPLEDLVG
jgi:dihydrofolate reductase